MTFGEKLQKLRKAKGWTQEELAAQISISRQALSKWEQGTVIPDTENVLQISKIFGVSTDYLLNDDYQSDADIPVVQKSTQALDVSYRGRVRTVIGVCLAGVGLISFLFLYIIGHRSNVSFPAPDGTDHVVSGFGVFIAQYRLEWILGFCALFVAAGLAIILTAWIRKKKHK